MDKLAYLAEIDLFSGLTRDELQALDQLLPMHTVEKGTLISTPESPQRVLYMLKKGYVRLSRIDRDGRMLTVGLLRPGNIFGEIEALSTGTAGAYAEAMSDVLLCSLQEGDLRRMLHHRPDIAARMIRILSDRLRELEELLEQLALGTVEKRLLYLLVKLAEQFGVSADPEFIPIDIELSHEDLSYMTASTRETVSLTLGGLKRAGIVRTKRRRLWVNLNRAREWLEPKVGE